MFTSISWFLGADWTDPARRYRRIDVEIHTDTHYRVTQTVEKLNPDDAGESSGNIVARMAGDLRILASFARLVSFGNPTLEFHPEAKVFSGPVASWDALASSSSRFPIFQRPPRPKGVDFSSRNDRKWPLRVYVSHPAENSDFCWFWGCFRLIGTFQGWLGAGEISFLYF